MALNEYGGCWERDLTDIFQARRHKASRSTVKSAEGGLSMYFATVLLLSESFDGNLESRSRLHLIRTSIFVDGPCKAGSSASRPCYVHYYSTRTIDTYLRGTGDWLEKTFDMSRADHARRSITWERLVACFFRGLACQTNMSSAVHID